MPSSACTDSVAAISAMAAACTAPSWLIIACDVATTSTHSATDLRAVGLADTSGEHPDASAAPRAGQNLRVASSTAVRASLNSIPFMCSIVPMPTDSRGPPARAVDRSTIIERLWTKMAQDHLIVTLWKPLRAPSHRRAEFVAQCSR